MYLWHYDIDGQYLLYSAGGRTENYLRGVQPAGADGDVTFTTILLACCPGRWPHIHFEVYPSIDAATAGARPLATSQLALPEDACKTLYASDGYQRSVASLANVSMATDSVFRDGATWETSAATGGVTDGYVVSLTVAVRTS